MNNVYIQSTAWRVTMSSDIRFIERSSYRSPDYLVEHADLTFELDVRRTVIRSRLEIVRAQTAAAGTPLVLDGRDFELISLALDGAVLEPDAYELTSGGLIIHNAPQQCELVAVTAVTPGANRSEMGLFQAGECLVTQCEADGFRRMTYFIDRPDVMASFRVRLEADASQYPVLLSNGDQVDRGELADGRHYVEWNDPHPKPSYVFAVMAGRLEVHQDIHVTGSGKAVRLAIYTEPHHIADVGFAMGALKRALAWDEAEYGLEYDLDDYSIVAIDGYSGAMENKGLNLFEAKGIVASPAYSTDNDYLVLERILAHEVFHNWTGNRVTCRDWFELCLKEGLTRFRDRQYAESLSLPGPKRIDAVALLRRNQFPEDDGGAAHPVKPARYADVQNLYTATIYEKGAELIRMLQVLLGPDVFRRGLQRFLERYDGQAVTTDELLQTLEAVSGRELGGFRGWYERAGRPSVQVASTFTDDACELRITQKSARPATDEPPLLIPVSCALFDPEDGRVLEERVLELSGETQVFRFDGLKRKPLVSLLRGLSAPVTLEYPQSSTELADLARWESDPVARWDAMQQLGIAVIRALSAGDDCAAAGAEAYADVIGQLIDDQRTDPALVARLIAVPDEPSLSEGLALIDLDGQADARYRLRQRLAGELADKLLTRYQVLHDHQPYSLDPEAMGRRALKNACLDWLTAYPDCQPFQLCLGQIRDSDNMNDSLAALSALCHHAVPQRDEALAICLEQWRTYPLAKRQWLTAQALGTAPDTVERLIEVAGHPEVDLGDSAQAMALFGSFFRQNRHAFHHPSGRGYEFLVDTLLRMDKVRPSGSYWLMPQISQWRRYDAHRRQLMQNALETIRDTPGISPGLSENVTRVLTSASSGSGNEG